MQADTAKYVKAADQTNYVKDAEVMGGGENSYQVKLVTFPDTPARNIIFYDAIELDAILPPATQSWQGELVSLDLSHPQRIYNVNPQVYYAAEALDP